MRQRWAEPVYTQWLVLALKTKRRQRVARGHRGACTFGVRGRVAKKNRMNKSGGPSPLGEVHRNFGTINIIDVWADIAWRELRG